MEVPRQRAHLQCNVKRELHVPLSLAIMVSRPSVRPSSIMGAILSEEDTFPRKRNSMPEKPSDPTPIHLLVTFLAGAQKI